MAKTKVLIVVKTYPTLSEKYDELVCTAGFKEDGSWIRVYPVPFRKLDYATQYQKWQWIELDLVKNESDFRPESFRPYNIDAAITLLEKVDTKNEWAIRKGFALKKVFTNFTILIQEAKHPKISTSLAIIKPTKIIDFVWEEVEREWDKKKLNAILANQAQGDLFDNETKEVFNIVKKLPYEFSYKFTTEDGKERKLMIEDWELGQLYWNCIKSSNGDETIACQKVKQKYFEEFTTNKDLYFFVGTTKKFHNVSPNPFIIIGCFYPPKKEFNQLTINF